MCERLCSLGTTGCDVACYYALCYPRDRFNSGKFALISKMNLIAFDYGFDLLCLLIVLTLILSHVGSVGCSPPCYNIFDINSYYYGYWKDCRYYVYNIPSNQMICAIAVTLISLGISHRHANIKSYSYYCKNQK